MQKGQHKWSFYWIIQTTVICDFGSVVTCSRHTRDLFVSFFIFVLFYFVMYLMTNAFGFPSLATLFLLSCPFFLLWYVYGMSPFCLPMLPPCMLEDLVALVQNTLPVNFYYPRKLYCDGENPAFFPNASVCLKSCTQLNFTDIMDPLAYGVCWFDLWTCDKLAGLTDSSNSAVKALLSDPLRKMHNVTRDNMDDLSAHTFCMGVNSINILPFLVVLFVGSTLLLSVLEGVITLVPSLFALLAHILFFNHTK